MRPANRSASFPAIPRLRRSTGLGNERDRACSRIAAGKPVACGAEAAGGVGAAFCRGDIDLAIRLIVLSALSVSLADRRVLALPADLLRWIDVVRRAGDDLSYSGGACRRLHCRRVGGAGGGAP